MKLRMYHVIAAVFVVHTYAREEVPPLPAPNPDSVNNFRVALQAVFGVGVRLQAFLLEDKKNENFLVSPISAAVIVGQLILGAEGEFRKQLIDLLALPNIHTYENDVLTYHNQKKNMTFVLPYSTLHIQLSNLLKALESGPDAGKHFILKEKSALFLDHKITLNETFSRGLKRLYEARIHPVDFASDPTGTQKKVNEWVVKNTNGLIKTILAAPPRPTTTSIFANAIYFKAEWQVPFSDTLNRKGHFQVSPTEAVPVTYMINQFDQILYSEHANFRITALPYTNEELGMYLILPKNDNPYKYDMKGFIQQLTFKDVLHTVNNARRRDVVVKIPKMSLSTSFSILDQLKKYRVFKEEDVKVNSTGVLDVLEQRVDAFANFTTDEINQTNIYLRHAAIGQPLRINDIVQQVVITINEKGTEAAAVSAATIDYMGGAKNFIIDRPFVFFIRHEATGASLFWGTVVNPTA